MMVVKLLPLLFAWCVLMVFTGRSWPGSMRKCGVLTIVAFASGLAGGCLLLSSVPGEMPFRVVRGMAGGAFLLFWCGSIAAMYRATAGLEPVPAPSPKGMASIWAFFAFLTGILCAARVMPAGGGIPLTAVVAAGFLGILAVPGGIAAARALPAAVSVHGGLLPVLCTAGLLFICSTMPRIDLFSPLTMKVMKFIHDFIHQFFESMLIPDHPFFRAEVWSYIGLLFGNGVGFWGGLILWLTPVLLLALAIHLQRLPSVAHIRQGALRRKLLASFVGERNRRQVIPIIAFMFLCAAVYQSRFPSAEYWDPKPVPVAADAAGAIVVPIKGEIDLDDGRIHKFLFSSGGQDARFFILFRPDGSVTVTLDACAICKPDGYGQGEGTVLCYYCNTLIPLETVGKPGGCNPVPVPFTRSDDGIAINGATLANVWTQTVQATTRVREEGR